MRGVTSIEQSLLSFVPEGCYVLELIAIESGGLPGKMLCQRRGQSIGAGNEATQFVKLQFFGQNVKIDRVSLMKEPDFKVIIKLEYKVVVGKLVENETESTKCLPEQKDVKM